MSAPMAVSLIQNFRNNFVNVGRLSFKFPLSNVAKYSQRSRRRPLKTIEEESAFKGRNRVYNAAIDGDDDAQQSGSGREVREDTSASSGCRISRSSVHTFCVPGSSVYLQYQKLEEGDKRFGNVVTVAKSRKYREREGLVLLEGTRLIKDAINCGAQLRNLYFSRKELLYDLPLSNVEKNYKLYKVQNRHLKLWSDVVTSSGLLAIFSLPKPGLQLAAQISYPITVVCDNIRDPGNLGTIIRTAAAAGCRKILLSKGCVDVWDPKVIRSGAGAHFNLPIYNNLEWSQISSYIEPQESIYMADVSTDTTKDEQISPSQILKELENQENTYEVIDNIGHENLESDSDVESDSNTVSDKDSDSDLIQTEIHKKLPIAKCVYSDVDYTTTDSCVLVIGGETTGLSNVAHKMMFDRFGQKVFIPMSTSVESLNSAIAGSIILYEINRQFSKK